MNTQVNMDSLQVLPLAGYKKAMKKDKKFLKKASAVLFILDHQFNDGKKHVGVVLFKKAKEVKEAFKKAKKEWKIAVKNLAGGSCQLAEGDNGLEWQVELKLGNAPAEKIQKKGKAIFKSVLSTFPNFTLGENVEEEAEADPTEELKADFEALKPQLVQVAKIIAGIKSKDNTVFTLENADLIQSVREDIQDWIEDYNAADEQAKSTFSTEAQQFQKQAVQLEKVAELLGKRVVLSSFTDQFKQLAQNVKAYQNS